MSKSCTELSQSRYHQSRTSRCPPHPHSNTEVRNRSSRCRSCMIGNRDYRRKHHLRRSRRSLSKVHPLYSESGCAESGCAESGCAPEAAAAAAAAAAESGCVESACAPEEAEKGRDRTRHGNSSALEDRNCTGWGTLRNRCTAHMCHHYGARHCSHYCRRSWGCGSADSGCATAVAEAEAVAERGAVAVAVAVAVAEAVAETSTLASRRK